MTPEDMKPKYKSKRKVTFMKDNSVRIIDTDPEAGRHSNDYMIVDNPSENERRRLLLEEEKEEREERLKK